MPIYEYVCHDCGHEFERIQSWSDSAPACTACSSLNVTRQLSPPAIHFKGSGWYITDSKKGQKGKNGANGVSGTNGAGKDSDSGDVEKSSESKDASSKDADSKTASASDAKSEAKSSAKSESSAAMEPAKSSS